MSLFPTSTLSVCWNPLSLRKTLRSALRGFTRDRGHSRSRQARRTGRPPHMEDTEVVVVEDVPRPGLWLVSLPQSMLTTPLRFHGGNMQDSSTPTRKFKLAIVKYKTI